MTVVFAIRTGRRSPARNIAANDYGSFAGSFTAPRDRLMGQMILLVEGRARGHSLRSASRNTNAQVPGHTGRAEDRGQAERQGESLPGTPMGYTGAADRWRAGQVAGRARGALCPVGGVGVAAAAAAGEAARKSPTAQLRTGDGRHIQHRVHRQARPAVPEKDEPTFRFTVHADVTDAAGETRSAERGVNVGYTALEATLSADDWQTDGQAGGAEVADQNPRRRAAGRPKAS